MTVSIERMPNGGTTNTRALRLASSMQVFRDLRPLWLSMESGVGLIPPHNIDATWTPRQQYDPGTAIMNFEDPASQPWMSTQSIFGYLWVEELLQGVDDGFVPTELIVEEIAKGNVRPSLLWQIEKKVVDPLLVPARVRARDDTFKKDSRTLNRRTPPEVWLHRLGRTMRAQMRELRRRL
jgi:hypothetical protein